MNFDHSSGYSPRACKRCTRLKRKCDKVLPKCYSCNRSHFNCVYQHNRRAYTQSDDRPPFVHPATNSEVTIWPSSSGPHRTSSKLSPIYFLDFELYNRTVTEIPGIIINTRPDLQALTTDIREHAKVYFKTIHPWIPFLSKTSFNERLLSPFGPRDLGVNLLFACIKLVCSVPDGEDMCTDAYTIIKSSLLEAEMAGILSFHILQAWILLCVYEFGHAIYPGAYFSISSCVKYAAALGINENATNAQRRTLHWIEAEERVRARWVVLILDRFSNLDGPAPSLLIEDPCSDTKLPIDDISWDQSVPKPGCGATISSPPSPNMGRFALMAMAANLLGQVIRHIGNTKDIQFPEEEGAAILDRALAALTAVTREEGLARGIGVCTPTVFCHSARILLALDRQRHERESGGLEGTQISEIIRCGIASDMLQLCQLISSKSFEEAICPFPFNAVYHTAVAYLEMSTKEHREGYAEEISQIKSLFTLCNQRWKLSGIYLELIEAREAILSSGLS